MQDVQFPVGTSFTANSAPSMCMGFFLFSDGGNDYEIVDQNGLWEIDSFIQILKEKIIIISNKNSVKLRILRTPPMSLREIII